MTEKISDYKVVYEDDAEILAAEVRDLLSDGWEPLGGIAVLVWPQYARDDPSPGIAAGQPVFVQALIRRGSGVGG